MANYELMNNSVDTIPIRGRDDAGDLVALPTSAGFTVTVKNSDPSALDATVVDDTLVLRALVPTAANISVEIDDGSLTPYTLVVDIVADLSPTSVALDLAGATHVSQPTPIVP